MKLIQLVNALPSLQKLAGYELTLQKLYNIKKLMGRLDSELAFYYEQREKILLKHGEIHGNQYIPRDGELDKANAKLDELLNTEIEGEIKEVVLTLDENIKLSYNDLVALEGFVRIGDE